MRRFIERIKNIPSIPLFPFHVMVIFFAVHGCITVQMINGDGGTEGEALDGAIKVRSKIDYTDVEEDIEYDDVNINDTTKVR